MGGHDDDGKGGRRWLEMARGGRRGEIWEGGMGEEKKARGEMWREIGQDLSVSFRVGLKRRKEVAGIDLSL